MNPDDTIRPASVMGGVILDDSELVLKIRAGETALYETLIRRYNQKLYRVARGMGVPDEECDDLLQQTYIQCYLKLEQFKGESLFSTWLTRILINQCLMHLRKQRSSIVEGSDSLEDATDVAMSEVSVENPERAMIKKEMQQALESAIAELPDDLRVVYVMREVEELSTREIAECLEISESNVKVRIHRARRQLRDILQKYLSPTEIFEFGNARCNSLTENVLRLLPAGYY